MKTILCIFFSILAAVPLLADIGESLAQVRARYGDPTDRKLASNLDEMVLFRKDGLQIGAGMKDDKCVILIFGKESKEKLTEAEVEELLKANGEQMIWKKNTAASGNQVWTRADNSVVAQLSSLEGILTFISADYMKAQMAKKQNAER